MGIWTPDFYRVKVALSPWATCLYPPCLLWAKPSKTFDFITDFNNIVKKILNLQVIPQLWVQVIQMYPYTPLWKRGARGDFTSIILKSPFIPLCQREIKTPETEGLHLQVIPQPLFELATIWPRATRGRRKSYSGNLNLSLKPENPLSRTRNHLWYR